MAAVSGMRMQVLANGDIVECSQLPTSARNTLYKTELCKHFHDTGSCRYGNKCQFAHGGEELRGVLRHPKYKTALCKAFLAGGKCPYGIRCRFIHESAPNSPSSTTSSSSSQGSSPQLAAVLPTDFSYTQGGQRTDYYPSPIKPQRKQVNNMPIFTPPLPTYEENLFNTPQHTYKPYPAAPMYSLFGGGTFPQETVRSNEFCFAPQDDSTLEYDALNSLKAYDGVCSTLSTSPDSESFGFSRLSIFQTICDEE